MAAVNLSGPPCPVCGDRAVRTTLGVRDHREGVPGAYSVVVCRACGTGRTEPVPEDLSSAYPQTYQQHNANVLTARVVGWAIAEAARRGGVAASVLGRVVPDADLGGPVTPGLRVLDVGAGNGNAVRALRRAGADAHGVEPSEGAVAAAHEAGTTTVHLGTLEDSPLAAGPWDVIRLFHVLEHVPDPGVTLGVAHAGLAPGGRLVIGVPNFGGAGRRAFGRSWDGLEVPRHLLHHTRDGLRRLLNDAGFEVIGLRTTPLFGIMSGSLDALAHRGDRQAGWGNSVPLRAACYPVEVALAMAGVGDGLLAVARPRV